MRRMHEAGDDELLVGEFGNKFDDEEWEWPDLDDELELPNAVGKDS